MQSQRLGDHRVALHGRLIVVQQGSAQPGRRREERERDGGGDRPSAHRRAGRRRDERAKQCDEVRMQIENIALLYGVQGSIT